MKTLTGGQFGNRFGTLLIALVFLPSIVFGDVPLDRSLVVAAKQGSLSNVQAALKQGANPNYIEQVPGYGGGDSPLYCAVMSKSADCVKALLAAEADPLQAPVKKPWMFSLASACRDNVTNQEILDLLIGAIKQLPPDDDGITDWVICPAARRGDLSLLAQFEKLGAHLGSVSKKGNTVFIAAAERGRFDEAEKWLNNCSKQYEEATNAVNVYEVIQYLIAHPFEENRVAHILEQAQKLGVKFAPKDKWNAPIWKLAAVCRLPDCARVLGCPPEEQAKIVRRSDEELALQAACNSDSLSVFTNLFDKISHESGDRKMTASIYLLVLLRAHQVHNYYEPQFDALKFLRSQGADVEYEDETVGPPPHAHTSCC